MNQRRDSLRSIKDVKREWMRGMSFSSESLKTPGHVNAFTWTVRVIRLFWSPWPLAQRIPGLLYMIDIPFWCYIERTCLVILCCLVTVQTTGSQTLASFSVVHLSARITRLKIEDVISSRYGVIQVYNGQCCATYKIGPWQTILYSPRYLHSPVKCQHITALSAHALVGINDYEEITLHQPQTCFQLAA